MKSSQASLRAARALAAAQKNARVTSLSQENHEQPLSSNLSSYVSNFKNALFHLQGLTYVFKLEDDSFVDCGPTVDVAVRLVVQRNWPASFHNSFLHWYATREQTLRALADRDKNIKNVQKQVDVLKEAGIKFALLWFQEGDTEVRFDFNQELDRHAAYKELVAALGDNVCLYLETEL